MNQTKASLAEALGATLLSPNVADSNGEPANLVDAVDGLARAIGELARRRAEEFTRAMDAQHLVAAEKLTEAVRGIAAGLHRLAEAVARLTPAAPR